MGIGDGGQPFVYAPLEVGEYQKPPVCTNPPSRFGAKCTNPPPTTPAKVYQKNPPDVPENPLEGCFIHFFGLYGGICGTFWGVAYGAINLGLSPRKQKQTIVNEFPEKNQMAHCNRGGGRSSKCATGKPRKGRWQHKKGSKRLQWKVFTPKKMDRMVGIHPRVFFSTKGGNQVGFLVHKHPQGRWFFGKKGAFAGAYWFCGGPFWRGQ